jgi:hypothetical protein
MQTFTLGLRRIWWIRVLGRNPLVRTSDRVEALVLALAFLVIAVGIAAGLVYVIRWRLDRRRHAQ